jgi:molybdopterin-containing oxidoreductase family iron-sulfur binding subunit
MNESGKSPSESAVNGHQWKMVIDLDKCTGCQACVVACHAENNVPTVGPEEVRMGRSRHWIRIERYWEGEYPDVKARFMPVLCQQCGHAPCEPVCPTFATYHSDTQDLNVQVYNRCIGTRYCANNCPYSARIFNWFEPYFPDPMQEQLNPDVTVRGRGVMEKCTFCIQRIHYGEEQARKEGRPMHDGDVVPACAQSCPTQAIVFGDYNDPASPIHELMESPRAIRLLNELGTDPAVIYLKGGDSDAG